MEQRRGKECPIICVETEIRKQGMQGNRVDALSDVKQPDNHARPRTGMDSTYCSVRFPVDQFIMFAPTYFRDDRFCGICLHTLSTTVLGILELR